MNQHFLKVQHSVRTRNESDIVLESYWVYFFLLSWCTLGIVPIMRFIKKIDRIDKFIERRKEYYSGLIAFCEQDAKDKQKYDKLSNQLNSLNSIYETDFLVKNKPINALMSVLLSIVTLGIWGFVVKYKVNRAWDNLQLSEQNFYNELSPILVELGRSKYPIAYNTKLSNRNFAVYLLLSVVTLGIVGVVWNYKIYTEPDILYKEFHSSEDFVLGILHD